MGSIKRVMTIAGSDSGGGAGIQADLKTFCALGVYGSTAITAITAQNTVAVRAVSYVDPELVEAQISAVLSDIGTDAVKIGMLGQARAIEVVAGALRRFDPPHIVLDPVMMAKSGDLLLEEDAKTVLVRELFPIADLITPNLLEASAFLGSAVTSRDEMRAAALTLVRMGARAVLLKGGHLLGERSPDCLATLGSGDVTWFDGPRIESRNTHGTGCTLSSAIASYLAKDCTLYDAIEQGRRFLLRAIESSSAQSFGRGNGPVDHLVLSGPCVSAKKPQRPRSPHRS